MTVVSPKSKTRTILMKFGKSVYIQRLFEKGELYFSPLSHHKRFENNTYRGDKDEGLWRISQAPKTRIGIKFDGLNHFDWIGPGNGLRGAIKTSLLSTENIPVYCLTLAEVRGNSVVYHENMNSFGTHALVIDRPRTFLAKIRSACKKSNFCLAEGAVEYKDQDAYTGQMGIFKKFIDYNYQNEFRLSILNHTGQITIHIGSLKKESRIIELKDTRPI